MSNLNPFYLFLAGNIPLSAELQCFWMAFQGSMAVRNGKNRNLKMSWFHAFCLSVMSGYAGATFTALWMGRPTSMLSNDLNMAFCIIAFAIANYLPYDIGYRIGNTMPVVIVTTVFAQLFRAMGLVKFSQIAFEAFKDSPSPYYPIPIFGPILLPTLLGNFGGFFAKGFDQASNFNDLIWIKSSYRFIKNQYFWIMYKRFSYLKSAFHSTRQLTNSSIAFIL